MTDGPAAPEAAPAAAEATSACPLTPDFLAPNMRKHVDPKAPVPLRMMAAKGLVPLSPSDMISVLFMLMYDPEEKVRDTAGAEAQKLPDRITATAFRDEQVNPAVLGWFLELYINNDTYAEMLILNAGTPDDAVARVSATCGLRTAEIIGQNQLRLLRHDDIIRELAKNPIAQGALIDGVCDFAVRSGMNLPDVTQLAEARVRLFGPQAAAAPVAEGPTADELISEFGGEGQEQTAPLEEGKRLSLGQKIMKMNVSEKIKLATKGNKEARSILIRDSNRLVSVATIRSPRISEGEVMAQAQNRVASDEVLRVITSNREWMRNYGIKMALVKNPKVPQAIAMRLLGQLHEMDVKTLARDKNVPGTVQQMAKKMVNKKTDAKGEGEH